MGSYGIRVGLHFYGCSLLIGVWVAQHLQLVVLAALDGKPQPNVQVEYFCTGTPRNSALKRTVAINPSLRETRMWGRMGTSLPGQGGRNRR